MKISQAEPLIRELIQHHVPGWEFRWDKATRRFGCCHQDLKRITISKALTELNEWDDVKDTVLHEIAHAIVGPGHGHDKVWKSACTIIGARPERCYDNSVKRPKKKWKGVCPQCGRTVYQSRRRNISCGRCCKVYNPKYKFVWRENDD